METPRLPGLTKPGRACYSGWISNLSLSSTSPGELVITWDAPSDAPDDYRVTWKKSEL